jgi:hypothetical protein
MLRGVETAQHQLFVPLGAVSQLGLRLALAIRLVEGAVVLRSVLLTQTRGPLLLGNPVADDCDRRIYHNGNDDHDDESGVTHSQSYPASISANPDRW